MDLCWMKPPPLPKQWPLQTARIKARGNRFLVDPDTHPQTISILRTRAEPLGIIIDVQPVGDAMTDDCFGGLLSHPSSSGMVRDLTDEIAVIHDAGGLAVVC